jgi:hypothetical protein
MTAADLRLSWPHPVTPDGRYFVVRGRLWRSSDPSLPPEERRRLVSDLMAARRDVGSSLQSGDDAALGEARRRVDVAKRALGERGPPWWDDGAPDLNRHLVRNSVYGDWFASLGGGVPPPD